ncbi:hypothetical protein SAMN05216303_102329 [Rhodoferax sp. OV413]|uniref:hypothetical protein n=1 Tax=Rhodoferax sp. OV413 TaxID=1855285 RepID=UPI00088E94B4|nr:hypothetical protein [Rhodoferax sp. OV413]SDO77762.1 hypothetical protein SAMN05216303_102329 [Rhodoferax sp. OV413]
MKLPYVIFIGPSLLVSYLAQEPDESDGEESTEPARTADLELAIQFTDFTEARAALRLATKRFPTYEFRLDVLKPAP